MKNNKNIIYKIVSAMFIFGLFLAVSVTVYAEDSAFIPGTIGSNSLEDTVPVNGNTNINEDQNTIPNTGNTNSNENQGTVKGSDNSNGAGDQNIIPNLGTANNNEDGDIVPVIEPSPVIPSGGSSSGGSSRYYTPLINVVNTGASSCPYLNDYLTFGADNNTVEVTKLQLFLKNIENINVDVNGIFDNKTLDAVKTFQAKYMNDTMGPWGSSNPTGMVFYTTKNKINEIYCNSKISLTSEQNAQIEAYKRDVSNGIFQIEGNNPVTNIISTTSIPLLPEIGSVDNSNSTSTISQTAGVAGTSLAGKVWKFVKWLFGY
jgi:peptidoglycan hydrolase-like protein with peptidoglycan-binding domain